MTEPRFKPGDRVLVRGGRAHVWQVMRTDHQPNEREPGYWLEDATRQRTATESVLKPWPIAKPGSSATAMPDDWEAMAKGYAKLMEEAIEDLARAEGYATILHGQINQAQSRLLELQLANRQLKILVAWQATVLSEAKACALLAMERAEARRMLETVLAESTAAWEKHRALNPVATGKHG